LQKKDFKSFLVVEVIDHKTIKRYLIPVMIYLVFVAVYTGIAAFNDNRALYQPVWDIEHYLTISESGYDVHPCTPGVDGRAGEICGNPGWYPMWPIVARLFRPLLGGSSKYTFVGLSFAFTFISFLLLFHFVLRQYNLKAAVLTLLALAFGPASFYLITGFPYGLFMLLFMTYLLLLYRRTGMSRNIFLFITAMALSLTYPTGLLIAAVPLVWYYSEAKKSGLSARTASYWAGLAGYVIPFVLGLLILWTYFYIEFDDFFLQLHFQEKYNRIWAFPFWIMLKSFINQPLTDPENLVIIWYGLAFLLFFPFKIKRELWIMAIILYLFSLTTGTTMSIYRHYLIIFPFYMLIAASSRPLWLKSAYVICGLVISLKVLFPTYMSYLLI